MPLGSIVNNYLPVVTNPGSGKFSQTLYSSGNTAIDPSSYRHETADIGGYISCKFDLVGDKVALQKVFNKNLLTEIKVYDHIGIQVWEGIITRLTLKTRNKTITVDADEMANWIIVTYKIRGIRGIRTDPGEDVISQANYGLLEKEFTLPYAVSAKNFAEAKRDALKEIHPKPYSQREEIEKGDTQLLAGEAKLTVKCSGYKWYLERRLYANRVHEASGNSSTVIAAVITADGQFVANTDIDTNTQSVPATFDKNEIAWGVISEISRAPDTNNTPWVVGMYNDRTFKYKARLVATVDQIKYTKGQDGFIRDQSGQKMGMRLLPNNWLRDTTIPGDPGIAYSNIVEDMQVMYISSVTYQEDDQRAYVANQFKKMRAKDLANVVFRPDVHI